VAARFCARLGGRLEKMKSRISGAALVVVIGDADPPLSK
jgi:hypothetical protein